MHTETDAQQLDLPREPRPVLSARVPEARWLEDMGEGALSDGQEFGGGRYDAGCEELTRRILFAPSADQGHWAHEEMLTRSISGSRQVDDSRIQGRPFHQLGRQHVHDGTYGPCKYRVTVELLAVLLTKLSGTQDLGRKELDWTRWNFGWRLRMNASPASMYKQ